MGQWRGLNRGRDRDTARRFRIYGRYLHEALQGNRERAHSWTRVRKGDSLFANTDLLESSVTDVSASVEIDADMCVSLPSIGLREMLAIHATDGLPTYSSSHSEVPRVSLAFSVSVARRNSPVLMSQSLAEPSA